MDEDPQVHRRTRTKIEQDIADYLRRGGKIEVLDALTTEERIDRIAKEGGDWMKEDRARKFGKTIT